MNHLLSTTAVTGTFLSYVIAISLFCLTSTLNAQDFTHPGVRHSKAGLDLMKTRVTGNLQPWKSGYDKMLTWPGMRDGKLGRTPSSLDFPPAPRTTIDVGYYENPHTGQDEAETDGTAAYIHAIQWYVTGNPAHAEKTIEILKAWGNTLTTITGDNKELAAAWICVFMVEGAEIVRTTYPGSTAGDWTSFDNMLRTKFYPVLKNFAPSGFYGNWDALMTQAIMSMGVFLNDRAIYETGVNYFKNGAGNGSLPHYISTDGTTNETDRDQNHEQMGVIGLSNSAEIAWNQGEDLYSMLNNRILVGLEGTARRVLSQSCEVYAGWDIPYNHYVNRRGLSMPYSKQVMADSRYADGNKWSYNTVGLWPMLTFRLEGDTTPITPPPPPPTPDKRPNLALNKLATASSSDTNVAANVVDGNVNTRWSADVFPQWITVDLGTAALLDKVEVAPYLNRAYRYKVEVSTDGTVYALATDQSANTTESSLFADSFAPVSARYVRLAVTGCAGSYTGTWTSIMELRVFGSVPTSVSQTPGSSGWTSRASVIHEIGTRPIVVPAGVHAVGLYDVRGRQVYLWERNGSVGDTRIHIPSDLCRNHSLLTVAIRR